MGKFIDSLEKDYVKEWYKTHASEDVLDTLYNRLPEEGYVFDKKSGIFVRPHTGEEKTHMDIVLPRWSDYHKHEGMIESVSVRSGLGIYLYDNGEGMYSSQNIRSGSKLIVGSDLAHGFMPSYGNFLELEVHCSKPYEEVQIERFDKFKPWQRAWEVSKDEMPQSDVFNQSQ